MVWHGSKRLLRMGVLTALAAFSALAAAQNGAMQLMQVDPPNWWAGMPGPMLLVRGEGLQGAMFSLSDAALTIKLTTVSENGHWAQVWLARSPARPETVTLRVRRGTAHAEMVYTFALRRTEWFGGGHGPAGFSSRDVLYLIMTDRFADGDLSNDGPDATSRADSASAAAERAKPRGWHGGDLRGIQQHLDYLQRLGVTAVWVTPVYRNHDEPDSYHGYGATEMYRVDEHYGSLDDLKALAKALHAHGMKLVLDTVPNHVGPMNPWVKDEPAPDWFHGTAAQHLNSESNFRALIDPHAPERDRVRTLHGWFGNFLPDMDTESPAVAKYLRQNAEWWVEESGADALRIDTFPYVDRAFWHVFNGELTALYPHLTEVGEVFDGNPFSTGNPAMTSSFAGGVTRAGEDTELYTPFDFPSYFALRAVFGEGAPMSKLADVLAGDPLYPHPERLVPFFGNHDTSRFIDVAKSDAAMRLAFAYVMTTRGMPQIYSGDELAMHGGDDPDNRHDFPGGFPGAAHDAFSASGRDAQQREMFDWVAKLAALRREHPALACGAEQVLASNDDWIVYMRDTDHAPDACGAKGERMLVALHRGNAAADLSVTLAQTWAEGCRFPNPDAAKLIHVDGDVMQLHLQGDQTVIAACK